MDREPPASAVPPEPTASPEQDTELAPPSVSWPPPGLERIQGDLWRVVAQVGPGGALLALPLLASASLEQDFWSLGVFGDAWWIVLVTSVVGCVLLVRGFVDLFRMFRRWAGAVERGYGHRTVATVVADRARDAGFVLQGARAYSVLAADRRAALLTVRSVVGALMLAGSLWLSVGFVTGALAASRGFLGESGLVFWTLSPLAVAVVVAVVLHAWENSVVRGARRVWYRQPGASHVSGDEVGDWHEAVRTRPDAVRVAGGSDGTLPPRAAAAAVVMLGFAVPVVGLVLTALVGMGPILADVAVPDLGRIQSRAAAVYPAAGYRLPADPGVTPLEAGEAMVALASVSGWQESELLREPVRVYEEPLFTPDSAGGPTGLWPGEWATELVPRLGELDARTLRFLEDVGSHPALAEIPVLARARGLDEAGALWVSPIPPDVAVWELPLPRYRGLRDAAYAHIGGAVAAAARGREDEAEERLREVLSMGLLLAEEGSILITNNVGVVLARQGAEALAGLYEATGRVDDALALRGRLESAERAAEVALVGTEWSTTTALQAMPDMVLDDDAVRGRRWESFMLLNTIGPCVNLNRTLFGPDPAYDEWVASVREELVRTEAEESLFEAARAGFFSPGPASEAPGVERVLRVLLGDGPSDESSCAVAVGQMLR